MDILLSVVGFLLTIGILVAFHEYGHFWVARRLGVRVLTYSLGFGRAIYSTRRGPEAIEYRVGLFPLGGYVRMLDEREGPVDPAEQHRAFNRQSLKVRAAIVAAGPAANVVLALVFWWLMFMVGTQGVLPKVGDLAGESRLAEAGLEAGDVIRAVDGDPVITLSDLRLSLLNGAIEQQRVPLTVERDGRERELMLDLQGLDPLGGEIGRQPTDILDRVGFSLWRAPAHAEIAEVQPDSPAMAAGLEAGARIVAIDGREYQDPWALIDAIGARAGEPVRLVVETDAGRREVVVTPRATEVDGEVVGRIGVALAARPLDPEAAESMFLVQHAGPIEAMGLALERSWAMTTLTLSVFHRLLIGEASIANLSGPVAIAEYAGKSLLLGLSTFLGFLALVSLSLAILNLLPIPMLDGGHLLLYAIEAIKGGPVGAAFEEVFARIGILALGLLMVVVFYNDIARLMH
ncbi:RIP metalloprotease RseP [Guyparkeria hydrothermalis]|uniref:Zinc metalloprotease n=1 Tax=Guyparkeria halophila TaxID=47960 RepID=A0A6I6D6A9_9GAMM|nr:MULTISPECIES: RIP metalloprotease RseP [Guyparkeria]MCL7750437.1 RIP metalloprotease RseP [Guyparkeria hydrothermalis]QGT79024.1 RIP metalloprotease RseP [Guyparkeria halophila]